MPSMIIQKIVNRNIKILIISLLASALIWPPTSAGAATASTITLSSTIASNSTVALNSSVTLTGAIQPPHQTTVTIKSKRAGKTTYSTLGTTTSDANGNFSYTFAAGASGSYKATWAGDADHSAAESSVYNLNAQAQVTLGKLPTISWAGQVFYVNGLITPVHKNTSVSVQVNQGTKWTTIARGTTNNKSQFSIKASVETIGNHRLRIAFSDTDHALSSSDGFNISLKWANPWKISAKHATYIVVNKRTFKLWFIRKGKIVKTFRVGVGAQGYSTPSGSFKVVRKATRPTWYPPKNEAWAKNEPDSVPWPSSPLGERGLYLSYQGIIIHGTTKPWLLDQSNRAVSHGCIRMKNQWIVWLYNRIPIDTPVRIYG